MIPVRDKMTWYNWAGVPPKESSQQKPSIVDSEKAKNEKLCKVMQGIVVSMRT